MKKLLLSSFTALLLLGACKKGDDNSINFFSIEDDKNFGAQLDSTILASPNEYTILSPTQYPQAYAYMEAMKNKILNSGEVKYKDEFDWELKIIHDDNIENAFATPGGYIYVYTGLMKYLDSEHELAGVVGHEIAHADRRHSTDQMTKQYGIGLLLSIVSGNDPGLLAQIATNLLTLKFSRSDESEADEYSVIYMCPTDYRADGAAGFFQKLIVNQENGGDPEFLSTHPSPDKRVEKIQEKRVELGCAGTGEYDAEYQAFLNTLP